MEKIIVSLGLIIGYGLIYILYSGITLKQKNAYLRYSGAVLTALHGCAQVYLLYSKWKYVLMKTDKLTYFQVGVAVGFLVLFVINVCMDRYVIKFDAKKQVKYCFYDLDNLRLLAKEKNASQDIQELLKYMTPKKSEVEDSNIEEILKGLTESNMLESYAKLKKLVDIREEKLKAQCK